jgi:ATP-dependent Lhr-like helicase
MEGADDMSGLEHFSPVLAGWFKDKFGAATDVQRQAWPLIAAGKHTLIAAPTGSGKTLAALMPLIDRLVRDKLGGGEPVGHAAQRGVRILYVTPLKALNNDIREHLFDYAEAWRRRADETGAAWPEITVGVRTGDTTQSTRASMLRRPPDVLVTTPESLYLLLTSRRSREILRTVRHVVVDEIHDLASGERGMHFSVSLERLVELCGRSPQRIGISATQNPAARVAQYLGGWEFGANGAETDDATANGGQARPRPVSIVESRMDRPLEVTVTVPPYAQLLRNKREDIWTPLIHEILRHIGESGTTLIFVGNRRLCERLSARLNEACGEGFCRSHHGSVSRERRLETEQLLREGRLRCLVATSSLELGIDIGDVDRVLQIDSPHTSASGIQRFGRSGHAVGGVSRGAIIVRTRGLLPEVAVLAERIGRKETEPIDVPRHSMAVLAQQIAASVAGETWTPAALFRMIRRSDAYHDYPWERFVETLEMLSGAYPFVRPLIRWDREHNLLFGLPGAAGAAVIGAGTIPQSTGFPVYHAETRVHLGELDEEFVFESRVGDVFQLGAANWRIRSIRPDRVEVTESPAAYGDIPFWRAEGQGRSFELSLEIGRLTERLEALLSEDRAVAGEDAAESGPTIVDGHAAEGNHAVQGDHAAESGHTVADDHAIVEDERAVKGAQAVEGGRSARASAREWLIGRYHFTAEAADSLIELIRSQKAVSAWPTHRRIVVEWYTDDSGLTHVVVHSWFGRRFNRTWLLALERHLSRVYEHEIQSTAKDNGIELIFRIWDPALLDRIHGVHSQSIEPLLMEAVPLSPMFAARFRRLAETSLLIARGFRRVPSWLRRLRGEELLREALASGASFPLVKETMRECLEQLLDVRRVREVLAQIERGEIEFVRVPCRRPSPLAAQFFFDFLNVAIYESDALTRDLRQRMQAVSRELAAEVFGPEAVADAHEGTTGSFSVRSAIPQADAAQYVRLLQALHHLTPAARLQGPEGVLDTLSRLQGVFLPVSWWESFVLPARVAGYRWEDLDLLCASGELFWIGRKDEAHQEGKIAFFRTNAPELAAPFISGEVAVPRHPELYERLVKRGASFLTALANETGESPSALTAKLMDLVWQGLVANDQFSPLRLHGAKRPAAGRRSFRSGLGRWYALSDLAADRIGTVSPERSLLAWTRHLLQMNGVLTKAVVQAFSPYDWEAHVAALSRMEDLGVVTRGLFVRGIPALQFATRETVERLREPVVGDSGQADPVLLSAADPANPYGLVVDWPAEEEIGAVAGDFARKPGNYLLLQGGRFLMWAANNGRRIAAVAPEAAQDASLQVEYVRFTARSLLRERGQRKVVIESWNGKPITRTELGARLVECGAEQDGGAVVFWPSSV